MAGYDYGVPCESAIEQCKRLGILAPLFCHRCNKWQTKENNYTCDCNKETNNG